MRSRRNSFLRYGVRSDRIGQINTFGGDVYFLRKVRSKKCSLNISTTIETGTDEAGHCNVKAHTIGKMNNGSAETIPNLDLSRDGQNLGGRTSKHKKQKTKKWCGRG